MPKCKSCDSENAVKNGKVRGKQRFRCKKCGFNFVEGDARTNDKIAAKKAMIILFYSLGKASFNFLAKVFDTWPSQVYRWVVQQGLSLPDQEIAGTIKEMEFDEMWHFVKSKKTNFGSSRPLIVAEGELWPGYSAIVILRPSDAYMTK